MASQGRRVTPCPSHARSHLWSFPQGLRLFHQHVSTMTPRVKQECGPLSPEKRRGGQQSQPSCTLSHTEEAWKHVPTADG